MRMTHGTERDEWRWLWAEVRPLARYQVTTLVCTIAMGALGLVNPLIIKWLIDVVLPSRRWQALALATGLIFAAWALRELLGATGNYVRSLGVERLVFRLRLRLFKQLQQLPAAFHARQPVGDLVQRIERDVSLVGELGSDIAATGLRMMVELLMTGAALLLLDWRLAAAVVPVWPVMVLVRQYFRSRLQQGARDVRDASGRQSNLLNEALTAAVQVQLLGAESRFARRYAQLGLETLKQFLRQRRLELAFAFTSAIMFAFGTALIVGYGGLRVIRGSLTAGGLIAFFAYAIGIFTPLSTAAELFARLNRVRASIRRVMEIEDVPDRLEEQPDTRPLSVPPAALTCTDVSFGYDPDVTTLHSIRLAARAGERVALVGESGCGKTSLIKLIPRLYDPTRGRVAIDGRALPSLPIRSLRRAVSVVPQDAMLFCGTIRENFRLGSVEATDDDIAQAAAITELSTVVEKLPGGWNTPLGPMGSGLSGGEKQRLAIARALIQRRPILVLDEATSALDAGSEDRLLAALQRCAADRIVIVVSHRLAVARWASRVVVLERGEIVEEGSHDALYRPGTRYHALWQRRHAQEDAATPVSMVS
jgi:ABC-type multidrug transport system fused ATPase/permease subunit